MSTRDLKQAQFTDILVGLLAAAAAAAVELIVPPKQRSKIIFPIYVCMINSTHHPPTLPSVFIGIPRPAFLEAFYVPLPAPFWYDLFVLPLVEITLFLDFSSFS